MVLGFNCQLNNVASPEKKVFVRDCLNAVVLWACLWVVVLIDVGRFSPSWAAPFPRQGMVQCMSGEIELSTSQ